MVVALVAGAVASLLISRRTASRHLLVIAGLLALAAVVVFLWSLRGDARRYAAAGKRQGYALGFGLGQYLKQTQPGRRVVILKSLPGESRDLETIKGLEAGLDGALTVVGERGLEMPQSQSLYLDYAAQFTPGFLAELKATGADIVVSFHGLPVRVSEYYQSQIDLPATEALWRSPEHRALRWVLVRMPDPWKDQLPGLFVKGNVLAVVREKSQPFQAEGFPPHLKMRGSPAELFDGWFELVTTE